jgi:succinyl-CoA synthetase alpha subunit
MILQYTRLSRCNFFRSRLISRQTPDAAFSSSSRHSGYDDTIQNLRIGKDTRVIFQGFTGKLATANAKESMEWGTNVVGGVKPKGSGEHLGKPVLPSVRAAMEQLKPDATGIYVAAHQATAAIEEAIEAEVPLIVAVAEHIPLHDIMRVSRIPRHGLALQVLILDRYTPCCKVSPSHDS